VSRSPGNCTGELEEVDRLGDIGVGFTPVLADFKNQPGHVIHFALAHEVGGAEQQTGALFDRGVFPGLEGFEGRLHRGFHMLFAGLLVDSHDLRWTRGIQRLDFVGGLDALAADDEVIFAAELAADALDGGAHIARVFFAAEIVKRLVDERALVSGCARPDGGFEGCHGRNSFQNRKL
jgi:hypothetical protein